MGLQSLTVTAPLQRQCLRCKLSPSSQLQLASPLLTHAVTAAVVVDIFSQIRLIAVWVMVLAFKNLGFFFFLSASLIEKLGRF